MEGVEHTFAITSDPIREGVAGEVVEVEVHRERGDAFGIKFSGVVDEAVGESHVLNKGLPAALAGAHHWDEDGELVEGADLEAGKVVGGAKEVKKAVRP